MVPTVAVPHTVLEIVDDFSMLAALVAALNSVARQADCCMFRSADCTPVLDFVLAYPNRLAMVLGIPAVCFAGRQKVSHGSE